jgi:hypothetical protein
MGPATKYQTIYRMEQLGSYLDSTEVKLTYKISLLITVQHEVLHQIPNLSAQIGPYLLQILDENLSFVMYVSVRIFRTETSITKLHNDELKDLYSLLNNSVVIKSRRMRWAGHVARMGVEERRTQGFGGEIWWKETTWKTQA